jgi:hypothetical protein
MNSWRLVVVYDVFQYQYVVLYLFKIKFVLLIYFLKLDARKSEPTGFFFASDDTAQSDYLMIIIHGMGVVRAGQWSRK